MPAPMPRIPLEDNFTDVIGKAQRGQELSDTALAEKAGITAEELKAVKSEERRVGKECPSKCRSRWSPYH